MYIVDFTGKKIELEMDAAAQQVIGNLLLAVQMEGGVGLVLPGGISYKLEAHDWEEKEEADIQKNIEADNPAKHNLPWSAKDYTDLSERFRSDHSTTIDSLAREFERTPVSIKYQLQKMGLIDSCGEAIGHNRNTGEPRKKYIYGTPDSGTME